MTTIDNFTDKNTDDATIRTYIYKRQYILKDGTIKNCTVKTNKTYKPNAKIRRRVEYTDEQKQIVLNVYENCKSYRRTVDIVNKDHFPITFTYVSKICRADKERKFEDARLKGIEIRMAELNK